MMNKRGIEMSFNWIFSIIVGAVFIFLAIYASKNLIQSERQTIDTQAAQQLESLLSPLETSIEVSARPRDIVFPSESRVLIECDESNDNSASVLRVQTSSKIGDKWQDAGFPNNLYSKYIFAQKTNQGKQFSSIILPFTLPYKIGQIVLFWSDSKCFINPPDDDEFKSVISNSSHNIFIVQKSLECPKKSQRICFTEGTSCDVNVDFYNKRVRKNGKNLFYEGNLLYAAIFSDPDIYECNLRRLNNKRVYLANLYSQKSSLIETTSRTGCSGNIQPLLSDYASIQYNSSRNLAQIYNSAFELQKSHSPILCPLWKEEIS